MTRSARRRWVLGGAIFFGAAFSLVGTSHLFAKQGVVKTRDGRTIEGDVEEKPEGVVVTVRGIGTTVARENVDSIEYKGSIDDQYKERLAKLPKPAAAADHLDIARWLLDNKAYTQAMQEVSAAQHIDPNSTDASTLQQTIESQMRLDRSAKPAGNGTTPPRTATGTTPAGATPPTGPGYTAVMHKYVTPEDVNTIRQMEWPDKDNTPRVSFNNDVKRRYVTRTQGDAVKFNAMSQSEQARQILSDGTPDEKKDVRVVTDPAPLTEFKRGIQATILTNCATSGCHGGPAGGKFFLYANPENDQATYTNFYLLSQAIASTGDAQHLMIDRSYPEQSLLALWGLPAEISKVSHPPVPGVAWRTIYKSADDPQYKMLTKWINGLTPVNASGSGMPVPQYGITNPLPPLPGAEPPAPAPATRGSKPATRPAKTRAR